MVSGRRISTHRLRASSSSYYDTSEEIDYDDMSITIRFPLSWTEQRRQFGLPPVASQQLEADSLFGHPEQKKMCSLDTSPVQFLLSFDPITLLLAAECAALEREHGNFPFRIDDASRNIEASPTSCLTILTREVPTR